jgi:hypothetical protein
MAGCKQPENNLPCNPSEESTNLPTKKEHTVVKRYWDLVWRGSVLEGQKWLNKALQKLPYWKIKLFSTCKALNGDLNGY